MKTIYLKKERVENKERNGVDLTFTIQIPATKLSDWKIYQHKTTVQNSDIITEIDIIALTEKDMAMRTFERFYINEILTL